MSLKAQVLFHLHGCGRCKYLHGCDRCSLKFLYPLVKEWFQGKANGNEMLPCDFFAQLKMCVETYIEDAKYEVAPSDNDAARLRVCEEKMTVLSKPTDETRKWYERELMQFCGFVMRETEIVIAGSMTSVLQVADTQWHDALCERACEPKKKKLRQETRDIAEARSIRRKEEKGETVTVGAFEMLKTEMACHDNVDRLNDENKLRNLELEGMRRNGWVTYRPEIQNLGDIVMGENLD